VRASSVLLPRRARASSLTPCACVRRADLQELEDGQWEGLPLPRADELVADLAVWWNADATPMLWVLAASGPYSFRLSPTTNQPAPRARRLWSPPSIVHDRRLLPPRGEGPLNEWLGWQLDRAEGRWVEVARCVEGAFLRHLMAPGSFSARALTQAVRRMLSSSGGPGAGAVGKGGRQAGSLGVGCGSWPCGCCWWCGLCSAWA
jgi:hypothetical protein